MKIGLVGCGNIGQFLLKALNEDQKVPEYQITSVYARASKDATDIERKFGVKVFHDFQEFIDSDMELIVEAANIEAVKSFASIILENGKNLVLVSVGALADQEFYHSIEQICKKNGTTIYVPSGAIGGLDVLKAAKAIQGLESVNITTRKPPHALSMDNLDVEKVVFEGTADEAIVQFPKNINVSIILSLAGIGVADTTVKIISDPKVTRNIHCIQANGAFGKMKVEIENESMPLNPKTSYLAALSVLATLKSNSETIKIG